MVDEVLTPPPVDPVIELAALKAQSQVFFEALNENLTRAVAAERERDELQARLASERRAGWDEAIQAADNEACRRGTYGTAKAIRSLSPPTAPSPEGPAESRQERTSTAGQQPAVAPGGASPPTAPGGGEAEVPCMVCGQARGGVAAAKRDAADWKDRAFTAERALAAALSPEAKTPTCTCTGEARKPDQPACPVHGIDSWSAGAPEAKTTEGPRAEPGVIQGGVIMCTCGAGSFNLMLPQHAPECPFALGQMPAGAKTTEGE